MRFWNTIKSNYPLKISAGVFAVFIWFYVALQNEYQTSIKMPINFELPDEASFVAETPHNEAIIDIKGKGSEILRLRFWSGRAIKYRIETKRGWTRVNLDKEDVSLPSWSEVSATSIEPKAFLVRVDKMVEKKLPVKPLIEPSINARVEPESVECRGGMDALKGIKSINTELVAVDTMNLPERVKVQLAPPQYITCNPTYVTIYFE